MGNCSCSRVRTNDRAPPRVLQLHIVATYTCRIRAAAMCAEISFALPPSGHDIRQKMGNAELQRHGSEAGAGRPYLGLLAGQEPAAEEAAPLPSCVRTQAWTERWRFESWCGGQTGAPIGQRFGSGNTSVTRVRSTPGNTDPPVALPASD